MAIISTGWYSMHASLENNLCVYVECMQACISKLGVVSAIAQSKVSFMKYLVLSWGCCSRNYKDSYIATTLITDYKDSAMAAGEMYGNYLR